jgi:hypothetical protein
MRGRQGERARGETPKERSASSTVFRLQIGHFSGVAKDWQGLLVHPSGAVGPASLGATLPSPCGAQTLS